MANTPLKKTREQEHQESTQMDSFVSQQKIERPAAPDVIAPDFSPHIPQIPEQTPVQPEQTQEQPEYQSPQETRQQPDEKTLDHQIDTLKKKLRKSKKKNVTMPRVKDELTIRIEKVMEEGIADAYRELTPIQQQEFKMKGEETAWQIHELMKKTHVKIKQIFKLLYEWLKMLPGINKFFLEQEAKIKADKMMTIKNVTHIDKS